MNPTSIAPDARHMRARCCTLAPQRCPAILTGFSQRLSKVCPPYANLTNWCATWAPGPRCVQVCAQGPQIIACSQPAAGQPADRPASRPAWQPASYLQGLPLILAAILRQHFQATFSGNIFGQHFRAEKLRPKTPPKNSTSRVKAHSKSHRGIFLGPVQKNKYMVKR